MKSVGEWVTGSRRGYIHVANQGVESKPERIPESLYGLRGNHRWALESLSRRGATHYTVAWFQGVPYKGYSNKFQYAVYTGYKEEIEYENQDQ